MKEEYLDNIVVDGLDETYATNMDVDDVVSPSVMLVDFIIDRTGSMNMYERVMQECLSLIHIQMCIRDSYMSTLIYTYAPFFLVSCIGGINGLYESPSNTSTSTVLVNTSV